MQVKCPCCRTEYDVRPRHVYRCVCNTKFRVNEAGEITVLEQGLPPPEKAAPQAAVPASTPEKAAPQAEESVRQVAASVEQLAATVQQVASTVQQVAAAVRPKPSPWRRLSCFLVFCVFCAIIGGAVWGAWRYGPEIADRLVAKVMATRPGGGAAVRPDTAAAAIERSGAQPNVEHIELDVARGIVFSDDRLTLKRYNTSLNDGEYAVPAGVLAIGRRAFAESEVLEIVILPPGLTTIEEGAFEDCEKLRHVVIPPSVRRVGLNAFRGSPCEAELKRSRPDLF